MGLLVLAEIEFTVDRYSSILKIKQSKKSVGQKLVNGFLDYMMLKLKQSELCDQFFGYADVFIFCLLQDNIAVGFILLNNL